MRAFVLLLCAAALMAGCSGSQQQQQAASAESAQYGGATLPKGPALTALQNNCTICHSFDMVYTQRLSKKTWSAEVTKMVKFGSPLPKNQEAMVVAYLTQYLGPTVGRSGTYSTATSPPESIPDAP